MCGVVFWRVRVCVHVFASACECVYTQGLYDSIKDASVLKVPIYITEIGLADKADKNRGKYIQDIYAMVSHVHGTALLVCSSSLHAMVRLV